MFVEIYWAPLADSSRLSSSSSRVPRTGITHNGNLWTIIIIIVQFHRGVVFAGRLNTPLIAFPRENEKRSIVVATCDDRPHKTPPSVITHAFSPPKESCACLPFCIEEYNPNLKTVLLNDDPDVRFNNPNSRDSFNWKLVSYHSYQCTFYRTRSMILPRTLSRVALSYQGYYYSTGDKPHLNN